MHAMDNAADGCIAADAIKYFFDMNELFRSAGEGVT
jgi:hypothetical protein